MICEDYSILQEAGKIGVMGKSFHDDWLVVTQSTLGTQYPGIAPGDAVNSKSHLPPIHTIHPSRPQSRTSHSNSISRTRGRTCAVNRACTRCNQFLFRGEPCGLIVDNLVDHGFALSIPTGSS